MDSNVQINSKNVKETKYLIIVKSTEINEVNPEQ